MLKDRRKRRASAVRERINPGLAIVRDESPDSHGLHGMRKDADSMVIDAGRSQHHWLISPGPVHHGVGSAFLPARETAARCKPTHPSLRPLILIPAQRVSQI